MILPIIHEVWLPVYHGPAIVEMLVPHDEKGRRRFVIGFVGSTGRFMEMEV